MFFFFSTNFFANTYIIFSLLYEHSKIFSIFSFFFFSINFLANIYYIDHSKILSIKYANIYFILCGQTKGERSIGRGRYLENNILYLISNSRTKFHVSKLFNSKDNTRFLFYKPRHALNQGNCVQPAFQQPHCRSYVTQ